MLYKKNHMGTLALILLSLAVSSAVVQRRISLSGQILKVPVNLQAGNSNTLAFNVPVKAQYKIGIQCLRTIPYETLKDTLRGGNIIDLSLRRGDRTVPINYIAGPTSMYGVDSTAEFGNLHFSDDLIGQDIAYFAGQPGESYTVKYTVIRTVDELSSTNPTFVVYFDQRQTFGRGIAAATLTVSAYILAIVGGLTGIYYLISMRSRAP